MASWAVVWVGVGIGVGVEDGVGVTVGEGLSVGEGMGVGVAVGPGVGLRVGVGDGRGLGAAVGVDVGVVTGVGGLRVHPAMDNASAPRINTYLRDNIVLPNCASSVRPDNLAGADEDKQIYHRVSSALCGKVLAGAGMRAISSRIFLGVLHLRAGGPRVLECGASYVWRGGMNDLPGGAALSRQSILELLEAPEPLIAGYLDLDAQAQPNGFDVTVGEVQEYNSLGKLTEADRSLSSTRTLRWNSSGDLDLEPGPYLAVLNERISLPLHIMALMQPRSSLLRSGVTLHTAVWDAGYRGRSQVMLTVLNPQGFCLGRNARIGQLVFFHLDRQLLQGYQGQYQDENLASPKASSAPMSAGLGSSNAMPSEGYGR